jgi:hypothetical protein
MTMPIYTSADGNTLTVEPSSLEGACRVEAADPELGQRACVVVTREHVPAVAADVMIAMHAAVGLGAPAVLQHPGRYPLSLVDGAEGITVERSEDPDYPVRLGIRGVTTRLRPRTARAVAATIIVTTDEAETDPDVAVAGDLAELIRVYGTERGGRMAAQAILGRYELRERAG